MPSEPPTSDPPGAPPGPTEEPATVHAFHTDPRRCPYLPDRSERLLVLAPSATITPGSFDRLLSSGFRRSGTVVYATACEGCRSCVPLRVPVGRFRPSASQRQVVKRNRDVVVEVGPARADAVRAGLQARHALQRGLAEEHAGDVGSYSANFVESCVETKEVRYLVDGELAAVSILDLGENAVSSVYHYFDPRHARRSLGVFSVLSEIDWAAAHGFRWYYLGFWVRDCRALKYKASYRPHEVRRDGVWRPGDDTND